MAGMVLAAGSYPPTLFDALRGDWYAIAVYGFIAAALTLWAVYHRYRKPRYDGLQVFELVAIAVYVVVILLAIWIGTA